MFCFKHLCQTQVPGELITQVMSSCDLVSVTSLQQRAPVWSCTWLLVNACPKQQQQRVNALFRVVRLRGHRVRKHVVMLLMPMMPLMYFYIVTLLLLPCLTCMRRRFKAVMNVLDSIIRNVFTLPRSVELSAQWDGDSCYGASVPSYVG